MGKISQKNIFFLAAPLNRWVVHMIEKYKTYTTQWIRFRAIEDIQRSTHDMCTQLLAARREDVMAHAMGQRRERGITGHGLLWLLGEKGGAFEFVRGRARGAGT